MDTPEAAAPQPDATQEIEVQPDATQEVQLAPASQPDATQEIEPQPDATQQVQSPKLSPKRLRRHRSKVPEPQQRGIGSRSYLGKQPRSKNRSFPSFSIGTEKRKDVVGKASISPGPAFYPQPIRDAPSFSFAGTYGPYPTGEAALGPKPVHLMQDSHNNLKRFEGLDSHFPGPGQYAARGSFGQGAQNLSKWKSTTSFTMRKRTGRRSTVDEGPAPDSYQVAPGLGKQLASRYKSSNGFGFGRECRGYETDPKINGPGPGAHLI